MSSRPSSSSSFDDRLARFHAVQALELFARFLGHPAVGADDDGERQVVAQRHLVVGHVVRGRDLDAAGAELRIHDVVGDDGNLFVLQRQQQLFADELSGSAGRSGFTATASSPSIVSGRVVATTTKSSACGWPLASSNGYLICQRWPFSSVMMTSSSRERGAG